MPRRSKSSARWLAEHASDPYVQRAREEGWRSRAVFKLEEIQRSDQLLKPGMTVVDLGAAPGGWSQYTARILAGRGRVIAVDILPMAGLTGVEVLQCDFSEQATLDRLVGMLDGARADLVLSDMAPNTMGIAEVDHARSMHLVDLATNLAAQALRPGGDLLLKVFQGREFQPLVARLRADFKTVKLRKPKASRGRSPEVYVLARGYRLV
jgi:23S rRNA (uridine2552-2'-O)-methyltransferase